MIFFFTWYDNECNILRDTISDVNSLKRRLIQTIFDWYIFFGWNIYRQENKYLWRWLGQWLESTAVWPKTQRYLHVALTVRKWNSHLCLYYCWGVCWKKIIKMFYRSACIYKLFKKKYFFMKNKNTAVASPHGLNFYFKCQVDLFIYCIRLCKIYDNYIIHRNKVN